MADPTPINGNFNYLDGKINTVSANINNQYTNLQSQISTVNGSLNALNGSAVLKDDVKSKGSATTPVYFNGSGVATPCTSINTSLLTNGGNAFVTDEYHDGTSMYRIWSNGCIEQWGYIGGSTNLEVDLMQDYSNTNYAIVTGVYNTRSTSSLSVVCDDIVAKTKESFTMAGYSYDYIYISWYTCGF